MKTHYLKKSTHKAACGTREKRSVALIYTSDRAKFDADRKAGLACEGCCASVDKMDRVAAKYEARAR